MLLRRVFCERANLSQVQALAATVKNAHVAALCRTREEDIRAAWEGVKDAANPRIHVFIATSISI